ncbi:unnamed protein product [Rotaria sp. Silwood1]|nr:unnamed protein product [Rotaria sp. Silwood1]
MSVDMTVMIELSVFVSSSLTAARSSSSPSLSARRKFSSSGWNSPVIPFASDHPSLLPTSTRHMPSLDMNIIEDELVEHFQ